MHNNLPSLCVQVALVDVLRTLGIRPDGMIGHSVGDLVCAYADGCQTAEETILSTYWRGRCLIDANLPEGGMAAIGKQGITMCIYLDIFAFSNLSKN